MKKVILLLIAFIGFGLMSEAQTISERDTKKISRDINKSIEKLEKAVDKADWKKLQKAVDRTARDLEKNADQVVELVERVDFSKLISVVKKVATEIENSVDTKQLQKTVEEIGVQIDEAFTQKKTK
jgi:phosphate uptake regulator